MKSYCAVVLRC